MHRPSGNCPSVIWKESSKMMPVEFSELLHFYPYYDGVSVTKNETYTLLHINICSIGKYLGQFKCLTASVPAVVDAFILTGINILAFQTAQHSLPNFENVFFAR